MSDLSSEELAVHVRAGSTDCFGILVERYSSALLRFLNRKVANGEDAKDLVQETFIRAHDRIALYNPEHKFKPWLFTIGARLSYSHYRRQREVCAAELEIVETRSPAEIACEKEETNQLWERTARILPASQVECLWLRYGEGLSVKEIAVRTGRTRVNVKVLLHRGRTRLAGELKQERESPCREVMR